MLPGFASFYNSIIFASADGVSCAVTILSLAPATPSALQSAEVAVRLIRTATSVSCTLNICTLQQITCKLVIGHEGELTKLTTNKRSFNQYGAYYVYELKCNFGRRYTHPEWTMYIKRERNNVKILDLSEFMTGSEYNALHQAPNAYLTNYIPDSLRTGHHKINFHPLIHNGHHLCDPSNWPVDTPPLFMINFVFHNCSYAYYFRQPETTWRPHEAEASGIWLTLLLMKKQSKMFKPNAPNVTQQRCRNELRRINAHMYHGYRLKSEVQLKELAIQVSNLDDIFQAHPGTKIQILRLGRHQLAIDHMGRAMDNRPEFQIELTPPPIAPIRNVARSITDPAINPRKPRKNKTPTKIVQPKVDQMEVEFAIAIDKIHSPERHADRSVVQKRTTDLNKSSYPNVAKLFQTSRRVTQAVVNNSADISPINPKKKSKKTLPTPFFGRPNKFSTYCSTPDPIMPKKADRKISREKLEKLWNDSSCAPTPTFMKNLRESIKNFEDAANAPGTSQESPLNLAILDASRHDGLVEDDELDLGQPLTPHPTELELKIKRKKMRESRKKLNAAQNWVDNQKSVDQTEDGQLQLKMAEQNINLQRHRVDRAARESGRRLRSHDQQQIKTVVDKAEKTMRTAEVSMLQLAAGDNVPDLPNIATATNFETSAQIIEVLAGEVKNYKLKQKKVLTELADDAKKIRGLITQLQDFLGNEMSDALEQCSNAVQLNPAAFTETLANLTAEYESGEIISDEEDPSFAPEDSWDEDKDEEDWTQPLSPIIESRRLRK